MPRSKHGGTSVFKPHPIDKDVWTAAVDRARNIYELFDHVAVQFSGGKDSTATFHVMLEAAHRWFPDRLPLRLIFFDEEAIPYQTERYVRRVAQRDDVNLEWYCLPIKSNNACSRDSPHWYPWAPEDEPLWCRPLPPEAITTLPGFPATREDRLAHTDVNGLLYMPVSRYGRAANVMGIRAGESVTRMMAVSRKVTENYLIDDPGSEAAPAGGRYHHGNITKAYPVYDWKREDCWTAPKAFGWDYNEAYDLMEAADVPVVNQRISPAYANEPLAQLWMWATCFPELWEPMQYRVPGARAAVRYAKTELYGFRGRPDKPADITWPAFLRFYLDQLEPSVAEETRAVIRNLVNRHAKRTTDPIVVEAHHPESGVCWNWLLMIAMRGDPKRRKLTQTAQKAALGPDQAMNDRVRARYAEERARWRGREQELRP